MKSLPKICLVVGARPNFVKAAPVVQQIRNQGVFEPILIHTGQHYDRNLSDLFFHDLKLPEPSIYLNVGSGSHAWQTAQIMMKIEPVFLEIQPVFVVVFGDVNSTVAAALTAVKLYIPIAHVEAGLRSFDRRMPEEINRLLTDAISDLLFTTEESGSVNLLNEGIPQEKIYFVGNTMVDSLLNNLPRARELRNILFQELNVKPKEYGVLTLHRPSNVDDPHMLTQLMMGVIQTSEIMPVIFPVHPRTKKKITAHSSVLNAIQKCKNFRMVEPLGYLEFLCLLDSARFVLTDSGGIQEETTALGVSCLTLRENTERPITITHGTNQLVGNEPSFLIDAVKTTLIPGNMLQTKKQPLLWDGQSAHRIATALAQKLEQKN